MAQIVDECPTCGPTSLGEYRKNGTSASFHSLVFPWQTCLLLRLKLLLPLPRARSPLPGSMYKRDGVPCTILLWPGDETIQVHTIPVTFATIWVPIVSLLYPTILDQAFDDLDGHS